MSDYAWLGVLASAGISTLAIGAYIVMALPYFDNASHLQDLSKSTHKTVAFGIVLFAVFFVVFYLGAQHLDEATSGPLLLFVAFILGLPISLLLGTETWDRHNAHGMNTVPAARAVAVATAIGLSEMIGVSMLFMAALNLA